MYVLVEIVWESSDVHLGVSLRASEVEVGPEGAATVGDSVHQERRLHAVTADLDAMPRAVVRGSTDIDLNGAVAAIDDVEDEAHSTARLRHLQEQRFDYTTTSHATIKKIKLSMY